MIDSFQTVEQEAARALAVGVPALLRGDRLDDDALTAAAEHARELGDDDDRRVGLLACVAHGRALPERVRAARALDRADVPLADGSVLPRERACRLLVDKEDKRAFAPLREAIALARAGARHDEEEAEAELHAFLRGELPVRFAGTDEQAARALLEAAQAPLRELRQAAEALVLAEPRDAASWARALDVSLAGRFASDTRRTRVRALLAAAGDTGRPVRALSAPGALAGWSSPAFPDAVRAAVTGGFGAAQARLDLAAAGSAVAAAATGATVPSPVLDAIGEALAMALDAPSVRRDVLGEGRDAEDAERRATACVALRASLWADAALALMDGGDVAAAREGLAESLGGELDDETERDLLRAPWPRGETPGTMLAGILARLRATFAGAGVARVLRERFDLRWALDARVFEALKAAAADGEAELAESLQLSFAADAFVEHARELL